MYCRLDPADSLTVLQGFKGRLYQKHHGYSDMLTLLQPYRPEYRAKYDCSNLTMGKIHWHCYPAFTLGHATSHPQRHLLSLEVVNVSGSAQLCQPDPNSLCLI